LSGAFWTATGSILLIAIQTRRAWSGRAIIGAAFLYTLCYWLERLLFQDPRPNWPATLTLNLLLLVLLTIAGVTMTREAHDRKP
jgi:hypothetical protein